jgi:hypothetical protein
METIIVTSYYKTRVDWELLKGTRTGSSRSPAAFPGALSTRSKRIGPNDASPLGDERSGAVTSRVRPRSVRSRPGAPAHLGRRPLASKHSANADKRSLHVRRNTLEIVAQVGEEI